MTKKTFIALADAVREIQNRFNDTERLAATRTNSDMQAGARMMLQSVTVALADFCESQNPEFKRDRWLAYINGECGPNGGKAATR